MATTIDTLKYNNTNVRKVIYNGTTVFDLDAGYNQQINCSLAFSAITKNGSTGTLLLKDAIHCTMYGRIFVRNSSGDIYYEYSFDNIRDVYKFHTGAYNYATYNMFLKFTDGTEYHYSSSELIDLRYDNYITPLNLAYAYNVWVSTPIKNLLFS